MKGVWACDYSVDAEDQSALDFWHLALMFCFLDAVMPLVLGSLTTFLLFFLLAAAVPPYFLCTHHQPLALLITGHSKLLGFQLLWTCRADDVLLLNSGATLCVCVCLENGHSRLVTCASLYWTDAPPGFAVAPPPALPFWNDCISGRRNETQIWAYFLSMLLHKDATGIIIIIF